MKESSLARVHVHELIPAEKATPTESEKVLPIAANDNELVQKPVFVAANDNEADLELSKVKERLGLSIDESVEEEESENKEVEIQQTAAESVGQANVEDSSENQVRTAQAAGGASKDEGNDGGSSGSGGGSSAGVGMVKSSGIMEGFKMGWKILAFPFLVLGGLLSLGLNAVRLLTEKIFKSYKL